MFLTDEIATPGFSAEQTASLQATIAATIAAAMHDTF